MKPKWEDVFARWDSYPDRKIRLQGSICTEGLWSKDLGQGLFAINNNPLNPEYRWQDIIRLKDMTILHRRWKGHVWFRFPVEREEEAVRLVKAKRPLPWKEWHSLYQQQAELFALLSPYGNVNFFLPGIGFIWMRNEYEEGMFDDLPITICPNPHIGSLH